MPATINASSSSGIVTTADNSAQLELQTASITRLTIDSSGNVGIGGIGSYKLNVISDLGMGLYNSAGTSVGIFTPGSTFQIANYFSTGSNITFSTNPNGGGNAERMRIDSSGNVGIGNTPSGTFKLQVSGLISDSKGDVRAAPINAKTSAYVLVATDAGQTISITTGGVTVNASVFSAGDMVSIFNNSGTSQTITQGSNVTLRLTGTATTGNRTLAQYGVVTLLCVIGGATPTFACTGSGLT